MAQDYRWRVAAGLAKDDILYDHVNLDIWMLVLDYSMIRPKYAGVGEEVSYEFIRICRLLYVALVNICSSEAPEGYRRVSVVGSQSNCHAKSN